MQNENKKILNRKKDRYLLKKKKQLEKFIQ